MEKQDVVSQNVLKKGKYTSKWYSCKIELKEGTLTYQRIDSKSLQVVEWQLERHQFCDAFAVHEQAKVKVLRLADIKLKTSEEHEKLFMLEDQKKQKEHQFLCESEDLCKQLMEEIFSASLDSKHKTTANSEACSIQ